MDPRWHTRSDGLSLLPAAQEHILAQDAARSVFCRR
jgi:hypothetical protein